MKLPFVTRARFEAMDDDRMYLQERYHRLIDAVAIDNASHHREIATLNAEIADRIRSETDAREQLRALKASAVMRDPKTGRLLPKVVEKSA